MPLQLTVVELDEVVHPDAVEQLQHEAVRVLMESLFAVECPAEGDVAEAGIGAVHLVADGLLDGLELLGLHGHVAQEGVEHRKSVDGLVALRRERRPEVARLVRILAER